MQRITRMLLVYIPGSSFLAHIGANFFLVKSLSMRLCQGRCFLFLRSFSKILPNLQCNAKCVTLLVMLCCSSVNAVKYLAWISVSNFCFFCFFIRNIITSIHFVIPFHNKTLKPVSAVSVFDLFSVFFQSLIKTSIHRSLCFIIKTISLKMYQ